MTQNDSIWDKGLTADSDVNACLPNANLHDLLWWYLTTQTTEGKLPAILPEEKARSLYPSMSASLEGHHIIKQQFTFLTSSRWLQLIPQPVWIQGEGNDDKSEHRFLFSNNSKINPNSTWIKKYYECMSVRQTQLLAHIKDSNDDNKNDDCVAQTKSVVRVHTQWCRTSIIWSWARYREK